MVEAKRSWMPWFRTLRWRIQAWYSAILLLSLLTFGTMLYWESARSMWREIDGDLTGGVRALEGAMRMPPPPPPFPNAGPPGRWDELPRRPDSNEGRRSGPGDPNPRPMPPPEFPPPGGEEPRFPPRDRPPHGGGPGGFGGPNGPGGPSGLGGPRMIDWSNFDRMAPLRLVRQERRTFRIVWNMDGTVMYNSGNGGDVPSWEDINTFSKGMRDGNVTIRQRGIIREGLLVGPRRGAIIGVGIDVQPELDRLNRFLMLLIGSGVLASGLGLLGGAWCLQRTLRPMREMQQTASTIRTENLSQRLKVESMDTELSEFAASINSMLDRVEAGFQQQRQFAADASHELRTPLAILLSSTELALSRERTPEAYRLELEKCQRAAQRMKSLIEALLTLSRMDASSQSLAMEPVAMDQLCRDQIELHQQLASQHHVSIKPNLNESVLMGHAGILERMVANLLLNGILYNRDGGTVDVALNSDEDTVFLEIQDTGIGIPKEEIPNLFQRFYRVDKARSRLTGGSGLGLSICELVVHLHHGKIEVASQIGVGSTFRILLPKRQTKITH
jgi:two-component system OmpR family sensor kinase